MSAAVLKAQRVKLFGNNRKILIVRGVAGSIALILSFATLQAIPLASAVTLMFLSPVFTAILGIWVVKERVKWIQWLFFAVCLGGILIIRGFDERVSLFWAIMGIGAAFFSGIAYNMIRKLRQTEHPLVIVFYFPLVSLPITLFYFLFEWVTPVGHEWLVLILVGVLTQIAQYFLTKAYQSEELNQAAGVQYMGILYALGLGWVLFDETFNLMTYLGMSLVLAGVILNVVYKHRIR